ncbi:E3 ubiquitin-protein ligase rnf146-like [Sipha flava]|uniref:E3 ubiquitin-protein ligase n=1 Tax=Sipha flava TaxID=143950 RepID=A0A2S2QP77_9HEMI|nr:E3 ubiquitin-protein ligase rnf146-like [Sipha flava]
MATCLKRSEDKITGDDKTEDEEEIDESSDSMHGPSVEAVSLTNNDPEGITTVEIKKKSTAKKSKKKDVKTDEPQNETLDCPVCLGPAVFPVRIPCGHIFCFLCVKGAARQANRCPMCRQHIPVDFDKNPNVLERQEVEIFDDGYQWFYEGKNGWWQYEKSTSEEIEQNFKLENKKFDLLICGTMYTIDLDRNVQYNRENPTRRRKVKREKANNIAVKGVAGVH